VYRKPDPVWLVEGIAQRQGAMLNSSASSQPWPGFGTRLGVRLERALLIFGQLGLSSGLALNLTHVFSI